MKFSDIPGHGKIKDELRTLVDSDDMPHALMLGGVSGIGKLALARAFMQYAHCTSRRGGEPCGECPSCRRHESFNHPDVHFLYPYVRNKAQKIEFASDRISEWRQMLSEHPWMPVEAWHEILDAGNSQPLIYVGDADKIIQAESYSSHSSKYKFFCVWLPEKMNLETANKLLKVIEEPTEGTVFLFVSDNEAALLPTITSRMRRFNMHPVSESELAAYVAGKYKFPEQRALSVARLAEGRVLKADEAATRSGEREEFGELFREVMRAAYAKRPVKLREIGDRAAGMGREKIRRFLNYAVEMARENFIYNLRMPMLNAMTPEEEQFSSKFSPFIHHGNVEKIVTEFERASRDIERNGNSKLVLFSLFLYLIPLLHAKS